jgi:drug/metabolite transporter (DMT)-like permease
LTSRTETLKFGKEKVKVPPVPAVKVCVVVFRILLPIALLLVPGGAVRIVSTAAALSSTAAKVTVIGRALLPLYTAALST